MKKKGQRETEKIIFKISYDNLDNNRKIYLELIDENINGEYSNDKLAKKNLLDLYNHYDFNMDYTEIANRHVTLALEDRFNSVFDIVKKSNEAFELILLGSCYECGHYTDVDRPKAFQTYLRAATLGYSEAKYEVGRMYKYGIGVEQNKQKMLQWYNEAAKQNSMRAQFELGYLYDVEMSFINKIKAYKWYKKSASGGHKEAQFRLARLLLAGIDIPLDEKQAEYWMFKALEQGHLKALQYYIGRWKYNRILDLSIQEIEKLYKLYENQLPKNIIQKLYKSYCKNGYMASTVDEKVEWFNKAKKLNVAPLNKEILDYYQEYFSNRLNFNDVNIACSFLIRWFNDKSIFLQWISRIDNILAKEMFAYKFCVINRSVVDKYFFSEYENFGKSILMHEHSDFYKQGKINIYERSIHWYERLFKSGNVWGKHELRNLYNLIADLEENIDRKIDIYKKSALLDSDIAKRSLIDLYCRIAEDSNDLNRAKNMYIESLELCKDEMIRENIVRKLCQTLIELADSLGDFLHKESFYLEAIQYGSYVAINKLYNLYITEFRCENGVLDLNDLCDKLIMFFRLTSENCDSNKLLSQALIKEAEKEEDNEKALPLFCKAYDYDTELGREKLCDKYIQLAELAINFDKIKSFFDEAYRLSVEEEKKNKIKQRYVEKIISRAEECDYLASKLELYFSILEIDVKRILPLIFNIYEEIESNKNLQMELDGNLLTELDTFASKIQLKKIQDCDMEYIKLEFTKLLNTIIDNKALSNEKDERLFIDLVNRIIDFTGELNIKYLRYLYDQDIIEFDIEKIVERIELKKYFGQSNIEGKVDFKESSVEDIFILANSYFHGYNVIKDTRRATTLYRYAAEHGHAEAQICLADCYLFGYGIEKSMIESYYWYKKAASNGLCEAIKIIDILGRE